MYFIARFCPCSFFGESEIWFTNWDSCRTESGSIVNHGLNNAFANNKAEGNNNKQLQNNNKQLQASPPALVISLDDTNAEQNKNCASSAPIIPENGETYKEHPHVPRRMKGGNGGVGVDHMSLQSSSGGVWTNSKNNAGDNSHFFSKNNVNLPGNKMNACTNHGKGAAGNQLLQQHGGKQAPAGNINVLRTQLTIESNSLYSKI